MSCSFVPRPVRSLFFASTSIRCVRPRRWTCRSSVSKGNAPPVEAMVHGGSTEVTAPDSVTAHVSRLAGRADRKHDRECGERQECDPFRTYKLVHVATSLLLLTVGRLRRHGRFTSSRARRLGIVVRAMVLAGAFRFFGRGAAPGAIQRPSNNSRRARLDCREEHPGGGFEEREQALVAHGEAVVLPAISLDLPVSLSYILYINYIASR